MNSPDNPEHLYKRTLIVVAISQIFGGAGLAAGMTVGALLAQSLLGSDSIAGIPSALITLGAAVAALFVGRLSQRFGRRIGLSAGFLAGGVGAAGIVAAAASHQIALLFVSLIIYGSGMATNLQARYAGTDLAKPVQRAKAVSIAMISTTFGAVAGPNLINPTGRFAEAAGLPPLTGPFLLAAIAFVLAAAVIWVWLRPDPLLHARAAAASSLFESSKLPNEASKQQTLQSKRGIFVGATVMILTQFVMIAIMTMTPIHMKHHGHGLGDVGLVIGIHIGTMYLPSLITGILVDKFGRIVMAIASGVVMLTAGLTAALVPAGSVPALIIALTLLGLGWNLGLISGTAMIVDATPLSTRAKTQGTVDVLVALSGSLGGALSGIVTAHSSYAVLSMSGGLLALLLIPVVVWTQVSRKGNQDKALEEPLSN